MPFEIPQQEPIIKTKFEEFADAMLRGCAITKPCIGAMADDYLAPTRTCAVGAWRMGHCGKVSIDLADTMKENEMRDAYQRRYGKAITIDNDAGKFTREQIAERIRAL